VALINEKDEESLKKASYVVGMYTWRVKDGFFKRQIQPAIIECVEGTRINIDVRPYHNAKEVVKAVKRLEHYYDKVMRPEGKAHDKTPLKRKAELPVRFVLPSEKHGAPPKADVTLTPWEALTLGTQLVEFARREKAKRPCQDCDGKGIVGVGAFKTAGCKPCKGTGFLVSQKLKKNRK